MAPSYPSIQSFYKREIPLPAKTKEDAVLVRRGDGFTEEELEDALDPRKRNWNPEREYEGSRIDQLIPGPKAVNFVGRIVNLSTIFGSSEKQPKAAGWHYLIVKDNTAAISVCLPPSLLHCTKADFISSLDQVVLFTQPISIQARPSPVHLDSLHLGCYERHSYIHRWSSRERQPIPGSRHLRPRHDPHKRDR